MSKVRVGDLFTLQQPGVDPMLVVHYVGDDSEWGQLLRVLKRPGPLGPEPCDAVIGETWFHIACPIDVAVTKGLATKVGHCPAGEQPTFRRLTDDGTWALRRDGVETNVGRVLTEEQRRLSVWNLATPLAVLDIARTGYVVEDDYVEVEPRPTALGRLARRLVGKPSPWSPGGAYWPVQETPGAFGASTPARERRASKVHYSVTAPRKGSDDLVQRLKADGWQVAVEDARSLHISRSLRDGTLVTSVTEDLEASLAPFGASFDGPDVEV